MLNAAFCVLDARGVKLDLNLQGTATEMIPARNINGIIVGKALAQLPHVCIWAFQVAQEGAVIVTIENFVAVTCHGQALPCRRAIAAIIRVQRPQRLWDFFQGSAGLLQDRLGEQEILSRLDGSENYS
jgi:hypothetical protein